MSGAGALVSGNRDVVVIGGSSGGLEAVREIMRGLPAGLQAAVFVVIHRGPQGPSLLADILDAAGPLRATTAVEGERFEPGRIYVAPADRHLLVGREHLHVRCGPRENPTRPAIDPLFRSAAVSCSSRVIGVVLSGMLDDGTAGLQAVRRCGGLAVVQDLADAAYEDMPRSALAHVAVDHVRPAAGLAELLARLVATPRPPPVEAPENVRIEAMIAAQELHTMPDQGRFGPPSALTCPDCSGALVEIREGGLVRYRCHTGHAFTMEALQVSQGEVGEKVLYGAMRAQHEQALLSRHIAAEHRLRGKGRSAEEFERRATRYEDGAETIRQLLALGTARGQHGLSAAARVRRASRRVSTPPRGGRDETAQPGRRQAQADRECEQVDHLLRPGPEQVRPGDSVRPSTGTAFGPAKRAAPAAAGGPRDPGPAAAQLA